MERVLMSTIFLLAFGLAAAQPPADFTLECDSEIVGTASYVDGELHASVVEGVECSGTLSVTQDADVIVELERSDDGTIVTLTDLDGSVTGDVDELSSEALGLPQQAVDGKATAQANREAAAEKRADGEANGDAAGEVDGATEITAEGDVDAAADAAADGLAQAEAASEAGANAAAEASANAAEAAENAADGIGNADEEADPEDASDERAENGSGNAEVDVEVDVEGGGVSVGTEAAGGVGNGR